MKNTLGHQPQRHPKSKEVPLSRPGVFVEQTQNGEEVRQAGGGHRLPRQRELTWDAVCATTPYLLSACCRPVSFCSLCLIVSSPALHVTDSSSSRVPERLPLSPICLYLAVLFLSPPVCITTSRHLFISRPCSGSQRRMRTKGVSLLPGDNG